MAGFPGRYASAAQTIGAQIASFLRVLQPSTGAAYSARLPPTHPWHSGFFLHSILRVLIVVLIPCFSRLLALLHVFKPVRSSTSSAALHSQHPRVTLPQAHCKWGGSPGGSRSGRQRRGGHDEARCLRTLPPLSHYRGQVRVMHPLGAGAERWPVRCIASTQRSEAVLRRNNKDTVHPLLDRSGVTVRASLGEHSGDDNLRGCQDSRTHPLGAGA
ncbi:uncharacterized protein SCHCODRAFT_02514866 [Schizophyllum commune H4-8]|uniref:uncharacterized protein n=1 Tax=Schizophyllum commune (strain H4-8 / FGSC 9210) TaxID=578458 RepID=UPI00215F838B|nr:uncharacterized protein SCHCODRAFT_02514866 [Schizophyllum commune H4-8]KAI5887803.1 hypothetical protein SCHCODRAFT_02514866 [Schizophyllum commune H4-8]